MKACPSVGCHWLRQCPIRVALAALIASMAPSVMHSAESNPKYDQALAAFEHVINEELHRASIPAVSVALVLDDDVTYVKGFGLADPVKNARANENTVYRAGSISKLFTAVSVMQLVERGQLSLDGPPNQALPDFSVVNPFSDAPPLTLRQLMCHRSGLVREAPIGGYLDPNEPTVAQTIASIAQTVLINPPASRTRYSNVGPTIAGQMVERVAGQPFAEYQHDRILKPLGMSRSAWTMNAELLPHHAVGGMRVAEPGSSFRDEPSPRFELGTIPAGNLYTTAVDLAQFARMILGKGRLGDAQILQAESLEQMCQPQLTSDDTGFGLGFSVNKHRGHKTVQHMGAVYGFTTSLVVLPEKRLAVVVLSSQDIAVGPVQRIAAAGIDQLLAIRGESLPEEGKTIDVPAAELVSLAGEYESHSYWARVFVEEGTLQAEISRQRFRLTPSEPLKFLADGQLAYRAPIEFTKGASGRAESFTAFRQTFTRVDPAKTVRPPREWQRFVGSYGPSFIPLIVSIRGGRLYAMTENEYDYRLIPVARNVFRMPPGMYDEETVVFPFDGDAKGGNKSNSVLFAGMHLPRRPESSDNQQ